MINGNKEIGFKILDFLNLNKDFFHINIISEKPNSFFLNISIKEKHLFKYKASEIDSFKFSLHINTSSKDNVVFQIKSYSNDFTSLQKNIEKFNSFALYLFEPNEITYTTHSEYYSRDDSLKCYTNADQKSTNKRVFINDVEFSIQNPYYLLTNTLLINFKSLENPSYISKLFFYLFFDVNLNEKDSSFIFENIFNNYNLEESKKIINEELIGLIEFDEFDEHFILTKKSKINIQEYLILNKRV